MATAKTARKTTARKTTARKATGASAPRKTTKASATPVEERDEFFVFVSEDGEEINLPWLDLAVNTRFIRTNRHRGAEELMWIALEEYADPEELDKIDELPVPEAARLIQEWQEGFEAALGEYVK